MKKSNTCLFPWVHMYYHNDQKVYPCCKLAGVEKFKAGSTTDSIDILWNSKVLKDLRINNINNTQPAECYINCFNNVNPLHVYIPELYLNQQQEFFNATAVDGSFDKNFVIWNINESNVCNFNCTYCGIEYSNQFDSRQVRKSFNSIDEMIKIFEENINNIKILILSSGESHLQAGYYRMLETLLKYNKTDIEINVHTNLSGYIYGKKNLFELLNQFSNVTVFASLDSYGDRAEYIRKGTKWEDIEATRIKLFNYPNIKFAVQSVITNFNLWSLPDFHLNWYERGLIGKDNIRYYCLSTPEHLHISVLEDSMKQKIINKYESYLQFLEKEEDIKYNLMTPTYKIKQLLNAMIQPPIVSTSLFQFYILKQDLKSKLKFNKIFTEFN